MLMKPDEIAITTAGIAKLRFHDINQGLITVIGADQWHLNNITYV